jgi:excisionase family DNA binding protein
VTAPAQPLAYTDAQVAAALHVSKRTVYRLRKSGVLRAVRIGRAVRTPAHALAQFLERAGEREQAVRS